MARPLSKVKPPIVHSHSVVESKSESYVNGKPIQDKEYFSQFDSNKGGVEVSYNGLTGEKKVHKIPPLTHFGREREREHDEHRAHPLLESGNSLMKTKSFSSRRLGQGVNEWKLMPPSARITKEHLDNEEEEYDGDNEYNDDEYDWPWSEHHQHERNPNIFEALFSPRHVHHYHHYHHFYPGPMQRHHRHWY